MKFITKEPINKGWSSDKKYCVTDENGIRYLLRVSDIAQHDTKQSEFNMMKQVASFGVPMCQPTAQMNWKTSSSEIRRKALYITMNVSL